MEGNTQEFLLLQLGLRQPNLTHQFHIIESIHLNTQLLVPFSIFVVQLLKELCLTLCDPMDCSTSGFPVLHHLPKFAQTIESV